MKNRICGMCGYGILRKNVENDWFRCTNCEELFELDESGEFVIVDYETWADKVYGLQKNNMSRFFSN